LGKREVHKEGGACKGGGSNMSGGGVCKNEERPIRKVIHA